MLVNLIAIVIILHGLVHLWYVALSQRLIEFQPEMGWTGESWIFTRLLGDAPTRSLVSALCVLATVGFVAGGLGVLVRQVWWRPLLVASAALSAAIVLLFWDGNVDRIVGKGSIALLIDAGILVALLVFRVGV